jgi:hypothetical protein
MTRQFILDALASALLAGEQEAEQIVLRCARTLNKDWRWLRPLAKRYLKQFVERTRPRHRDVVALLARDKGFAKAAARNIRHLSIAHWVVGTQDMQPVEAAREWSLPVIESAGALAEWLGIDDGELAWFADLRGLGQKTKIQPLSHYNYRVVAKRSGGLRLVEAPKARLKALQTRILRDILDKIPPHPQTHGFVRSRSIKTFALPHTGKQAVLRIDLRDFFPSFKAARVQTLFRVLGYPETVADILGGICTTTAPRGVWAKIEGADRREIREAFELYRHRHLPQGAPTSPALANICCYRADCRLSALARASGAEYTRYADDLAFSGGEGFARGVNRFSAHVAAILYGERLRVNHHKTRIMRQGVRQHLAGIVVNERTNVRRTDFESESEISSRFPLAPSGTDRFCSYDQSAKRQPSSRDLREDRMEVG